MVSNYIRLQALFVLSLVVVYIFIIFLWFIAEDEAHRKIAERDFAKVIQSRNQLRDSLLSGSKLSVTEDKKVRSLRFICNAWLRKLNNELSSVNKHLKKRLHSLEPPVGLASGVYIAQNKRLFLTIGNSFDKYLEPNWARSFYSALRHGKRFFQEFISKLYTREFTVEEFEATSDSYQILQIKGRSYYRYYTTIKNFQVLLLVDLTSINGPIILNHIIDALIADDKRFTRDSIDMLDWSGQSKNRSNATSIGLRFNPKRIGVVDFLINKWVSHVTFLIVLVVMIGMGGYQILSLRLELRVMSFLIVSLTLITLIHRNQSLKVSEMNYFHGQTTINSETHRMAKEIEDLYQDRLDDFLDKVRIGLNPLENSKLRYLQISVNPDGEAQIIDNIDYPILTLIASKLMSRWHLLRSGFDPDSISLKDELDNRLKITLPDIGPLALGVLSKASKLIKSIKFSRANYKLFELNFTGENYILIIPGMKQDKVLTAKLICLNRNDLMTHFLESAEWEQNRFGIVNLSDTKALFQNFEQTWTEVRLDSFLSNRNLPESLREDRDINWVSLKWDDLLLLHKIAPSTKSTSYSSLVKIIGGILILFCALIIFQKVFINWIDRLVEMLNTYRLKSRMQVSKFRFFRHEGYRLSSQLIKLVEFIETQPQKEIKLCSFLEDFLTRSRSEYLSLTILDLHYGRMDELEFKGLMDIANKQLERFDGFQLDGGLNCLRLVFQTDGHPTLVQNSIEAGLVIRDWLKNQSEAQFSISVRSGQFRLSLSKSSPDGSPIISIQNINVSPRNNPCSVNNLVVDNASQKLVEGIYDFKEIDDHFYQVMIT